MEKRAHFLSCHKNKAACRVTAWTSLTIGVIALGLYAGRELRSRYRFSRRTPYDFFSHAGDSAPRVSDYGVGI